MFSVEWTSLNPVLFIFISLMLNILIALSGIIPSAFLTAANIGILGFQKGVIVSITGEALGAAFSFVLYRYSLTKLPNPQKTKMMDKLLDKLKNTGGIEAVSLVLILRILPFIPSGLVTLAAAYSKMRLIPFGIASTIGKIPALLIEAYSIHFALDLSFEWKAGVVIVCLMILLVYFILKKRRSNN